MFDEDDEGAIAWPRIYRFGPAWTVGIVVMSVAFVAGGVASIVFRTQAFGHAPALGWFFGMPAFILGLAVFLTLRGRLILHENRLEYRAFFTSRTVRRDEIRRTSRLRQTYGLWGLTLELSYGRKTRISDFGRMDQIFARWFDAFPNAEAEAEAAAADALLANSAFGGDEDTRRAAIVRDAGWITWLGRLGWAAGVWGFVYPHPYSICLFTLLALPAAAFVLVLLSRGRWTLAEASEGRLSLAGMAALPAMMVGLRELLDDGLVDWRVGALAGGIAGLVLFLPVLAVERRLKPGVWLVVVAACLLYGWGGLLFLNRHFDTAPGKVYPVRVLDKSTDKEADPLTVTTWATRPSGNEIRVDHVFARKVKLGDTICVFAYPGALRIPWYQYDVCK